MGTGNALLLQGGTQVAITNEATGLWTVTHGVITSNGVGTLSFNNAGILRKSGSNPLNLTGWIPYNNTQLVLGHLYDAATLYQSIPAYDKRQSIICAGNHDIVCPTFKAPLVHKGQATATRLDRSAGDTIPAIGQI